MKSPTNTILVLILVTILTPGFSQTAIQVDYMYVKPENVNDYLEIESQWKALHEQRIKDGNITGWLLYEVMFTGENDPYNYVTVTYFKDFGAMENPFPENLFEKVYGDKDFDEFIDKTYDSRDLVYSRAFHSIVMLPPKQEPSNYITLSDFNVEPGKEGEYESIEKEIWEPMHKIAREEGKLNSWGIWYMYPNPGEGYQYVAAEGYASMADSYDYRNNYTEYFEKAHPNENIDVSFQKTQSVRQLVESWVWRLVDYAWQE